MNPVLMIAIVCVIMLGAAMAVHVIRSIRSRRRMVRAQSDWTASAENLVLESLHPMSVADAKRWLRRLSVLESSPHRHDGYARLDACLRWTKWEVVFMCAEGRVRKMLGQNTVLAMVNG